MLPGISSLAALLQPKSYRENGRDDGLLVIDRGARITAGDKVALVHEGEALIARTADSCVITEDGQRIAGDEQKGIVFNDTGIIYC